MRDRERVGNRGREGRLNEREGVREKEQIVTPRETNKDILLLREF